MKQETKEFLLAEYEHLRTACLDIHGTRNRAVAFYFTILGAVAAAGLGLVGRSSCDTPPWIGDRYVGTLVCLPRYFAVPSLVFLLLMSCATLLLMIRWHTLMAEYVTGLNRIRAAFLAEDEAFLREYLILPTDQNTARVFRTNFWILMVVNVFAALMVAFAIAYVLNAPGVQKIAYPRTVWAWLPIIGGLLWAGFWTFFYCHQCRRVDERIGARLPRGEGSTMGLNDSATSLKFL